MAISYSPSAHRPGTPGISDRFEEILSAAAAYFSARWKLARVEAGQVGGRLLQGVLAAVGALICVVFGYAVLVYALIALAAWQWFEGRMGVPALIVAGVHLAAAVGLVWWLKHLASGAAFFPATRLEFEEDHQWLIQRQK